MGNLRVSPAASVAVGAAGSVLTARRCGGSGFVVMVTGAGDVAPLAIQTSNVVADGVPPSAGTGTMRSDAEPATTVHESAVAVSVTMANPVTRDPAPPLLVSRAERAPVGALSPSVTVPNGWRAPLRFGASVVPAASKKSTV